MLPGPVNDWWLQSISINNDLQTSWDHLCIICQGQFEHSNSAFLAAESTGPAKGQPQQDDWSSWDEHEFQDVQTLFTLNTEYTGSHLSSTGVLCHKCSWMFIILVIHSISRQTTETPHVPRPSSPNPSAGSSPHAWVGTPQNRRFGRWATEAPVMRVAGPDPTRSTNIYWIRLNHLESIRFLKKYKTCDINSY
jgi:hypothetical protein